MSDTYGKSVTLTIFGESHGPAVGATVTGLAPGVPVDMEFMRGQMEKRRAKGKISTSRTEADAVRVLSGVYRGAATGTALTLVIENTNTRSGDYTKTEELLRPGHADYTAHMKYGGHQDARGGGHFSGRLTAPVVAAGSIFTKLLQTKGVAIATHLAQCAGIDDAPFSGDPARLKEQLDALNAADFAVLDPLRARAMTPRAIPWEGFWKRLSWACPRAWASRFSAAWKARWPRCCSAFPPSRVWSSAWASALRG